MTRRVTGLTAVPGFGALLAAPSGRPVVTITAGLRVALHDRTGRQVDLASLVGVPSSGTPSIDRLRSRPARVSGRDPRADVDVVIEPSRRPFSRRGMEPVTEGVWRGADGEVLLDSPGGSGYSQLWTIAGDSLVVRNRWSPTPAEAAGRLRSRFRALQAQVLLHHPALWLAGVRGFAPLHVSVVEVAGKVLMLAGPDEVGRSALMSAEHRRGALVTGNNVAVSDGLTAFGLREATTARHVPELRPDAVVVVRRGTGETSQVRPVPSRAAHRALVAGTMAAAELRRYWELQAVLSLATGLGPIAPPVSAVARRLTRTLPASEVELGQQTEAALQGLLDGRVQPPGGLGVSRPRRSGAPPGPSWP